MIRFLPFLMLVVLGEISTWADEDVLPGKGFEASRYEKLWSKSPFAVASPETATDSSDYLLVGIAKLDGVSYASLVDKPTQQQRFLLSSDKPVKGLTLVSIKQGQSIADSSAVIQKNGESITLKLEAPPAPPASGPGLVNGAGQIVPPPMIPQMNRGMPQPGASQPAPPIFGNTTNNTGAPIPNGAPGGPGAPGAPGAPQAPVPHFRHSPIHVPPQPGH